MSIHSDVLDIPRVLGTKEKGTVFSGLAVMSEVTTLMTKRNTPYVRGSLRSGTSMVDFKVWDDTALRGILSENNLAGRVLFVEGVTDVYQGKTSLTLSNAYEVDDVDKTEVLAAKYGHQYWDALNQVLQQNFKNPDLMNLWSMIMTPVQDRFESEFAGTRMHDAVYGGLLGHSFKVTRMMARVLAWYPAITNHLNQRDEENPEEYRNSVDMVLFIMAMHDLGKIWEYNDGDRTDIACITHRTLLIEYLASNYREALVEAFGTKGYYRLLAAEAQHHGQYEERPQTIEGMILHWVDGFETHMTILSEGVEAGEFPVRVDDFRIE